MQQKASLHGGISIAAAAGLSALATAIACWLTNVPFWGSVGLVAFAIAAAIGAVGTARLLRFAPRARSSNGTAKQSRCVAIGDREVPFEHAHGGFYFAGAALSGKTAHGLAPALASILSAPGNSPLGEVGGVVIDRTGQLWTRTNHFPKQSVEVVFGDARAPMNILDPLATTEDLAVDLAEMARRGLRGILPGELSLQGWRNVFAAVIAAARLERAEPTLTHIREVIATLSDTVRPSPARAEWMRLSTPQRAAFRNTFETAFSILFQQSYGRQFCAEGAPDFTRCLNGSVIFFTGGGNAVPPLLQSFVAVAVRRRMETLLRATNIQGRTLVIAEDDADQGLSTFDPIFTANCGQRRVIHLLAGRGPAAAGAFKALTWFRLEQHAAIQEASALTEVPEKTFCELDRGRSLTHIAAQEAKSVAA